MMLMRTKLILLLLLSIIMVQGCVSFPGKPVDTQSGRIGSPTPTVASASLLFSPTPGVQLSHTPVPAFTPTIEIIRSPGSALPSTGLSTLSTGTALLTSVPATPLASPVNSRWLVVVSESVPPGAIDLIHTSGMGQRKIYEGHFLESPSWSPDGQWIAFVESGTGFPSNIYLIRPDGSSLQQITTSGGVGSLAWSPDGSSIVYSESRTEGQRLIIDLFIIDVSTRTVRQLTDTPYSAEYYPVFSPDGAMISFVQSRVGDQESRDALMLINYDGSSPRTLVDTLRVQDTFSWSPDGSQIVFSSGDVCSDLYIVSLRDGDVRPLTEPRGSAVTPAWSPDGEWIAFYGAEVCNPGMAADVRFYLIRPDGSGMVAVPTVAGRRAISPNWAPLPALEVNDMYRITESGSRLNLRSAPAITGESIRILTEGQEIQVLEGPVEMDSYLWWQVRLLGTEQEGWVAEIPGWFAAQR